MTTQPHSQLSAGVPPREERPAPDVLRALMAAAGALISLGAIIAAAELHSRSRFAAVVLALVLGLFGYLVLAGPDPLMAPTGVVLVAVACGALPPLLLVDDRTTSLTGVFALMALLWAGAWLAPLTRGRPFLLGLALCGGWMLLLSVAEDDLGAGAGVGASNTVLRSDGCRCAGRPHAADRAGWHGVRSRVASGSERTARAALVGRHALDRARQRRRGPHLDRSVRRLIALAPRTAATRRTNAARGLARR